MSPLVAKKNTPLDRAPFEDSKVLEARLKKIQKSFGKRVDVRSTSVRWAWIEYQLAQGGWDMADVAEAAYKEGGNFSAWKRALKAFQQAPVPARVPIDDRPRPGAILDFAAS